MSAAARLRRVALALFAVAASLGLMVLFLRIAVPWVALGWILFVPWLLALDRAGSTRAALGVGYAMSVAFALVIFGWFPPSMASYAGVSSGWCWFLFALGAPLLEPQFLTCAVARHLAKRWARPGDRLRPALVGALVYVGTEGLWPKLFADTLGHGLYASVYLRQGADLAGAHGLTLVLLLGNEAILAAGLALASGARRRARAPVAAVGALLLASFGYGYIRYAQVTAHVRHGSEVVVGAVQANITRYDQLARQMGMYQVVRTVLDTHYALSNELLAANKPDLLVWPETVYPTTFGTPKSQDGLDLDNEIARFVQERQVPLIFGAYDVDEAGREYNAAVLLEPSHDGRLEFETYRKTMLFPITEWMPDALESPRVRELLPWAGTWKRGPGPRAVSFQLRGGKPIRLAPLICYESIFPGYVAEAARQGAELLVTLSNDTWFTDEAAHHHLTVAAFRSIETRLPQVRVTNSGISALIDPTGEILAHTGYDRRERVALAAPRVDRIPTLMVALGDWLGPPTMIAGLALLGWSAIAARRRARP